MTRRKSSIPGDTHRVPFKIFGSRYGRYRDLCAALKISRTTLWRWSQLSDFPKPLRRGNTVLFDIDAVEAWLTDGRSK